MLWGIPRLRFRTRLEGADDGELVSSETQNLHLVAGVPHAFLTGSPRRSVPVQPKTGPVQIGAKLLPAQTFPRVS